MIPNHSFKARLPVAMRERNILHCGTIGRMSLNFMGLFGVILAGEKQNYVMIKIGSSSRRQKKQPEESIRMLRIFAFNIRHIVCTILLFEKL